MPSSFLALATLIALVAASGTPQPLPLPRCRLTPSSSLHAHLAALPPKRVNVLASLAALARPADEVVARVGNMLAAGGVVARVYMSQDGVLVVEAASVLDAHLAKDFLVKQDEVREVSVSGAKFARFVDDDEADEL